MKQHYDTRLSVELYLDALQGVETQFALIRLALGELSKNAIKGFLKARLEKELGNISEAFEKAKENAQGQVVEVLDDVEKGVKKLVKKQHRKDSRPSDTRFKIELSEDRLNQSELLLMVAHFESFMKEVHRTFLTAAPAKVFSKRDTKFMLREAFEDEAGGLFSKFLKELVIKEVKKLDAMRIEQRSEYFSEYFGVSFGSQVDIGDLKEIMEMRNKISHEIYCPPPLGPEEVTVQPLVPDKMLELARGLFREVPRRCVEAGAKVYPSHFR